MVTNDANSGGTAGDILKRRQKHQYFQRKEDLPYRVCSDLRPRPCRPQKSVSCRRFLHFHHSKSSIDIRRISPKYGVKAGDGAKEDSDGQNRQFEHSQD